ncbi:MAG: hypothetical protein GXY44_02215 [Phycisphaerales bacterium]|nr:hypothetical protein [Phycisphaerales bacterium]
MTKRDLGKLGIHSLAQLEKPLPQGIRAQANVVLRRDDDGTEYNRVRSFKVIGVDEDPYAPVDDYNEPQEMKTASAGGAT